MMLDWIGETGRAKSIENAVAEVIREGKVRTYDMGGTSTSLDVGRAVAAKI